jgi:hypothetical protein
MRERRAPRPITSAIREDDMTHNLQFYIDGAWVEPTTPNYPEVIDPSN